MIFRKLSLYWYMKRDTLLDTFYRCMKRAVKVQLCNRKVCQLSKHLPAASNTMNYVILKETFSGRTL